MSAPKKVFAARNAPYGLGQMVRSWGASVKVNPYISMSDATLEEAAPGMTREAAAIEFEHGWNYEGAEGAEKPPDEKGSAWEREYGRAMKKLKSSGGGE